MTHKSISALLFLMLYSLSAFTQTDSLLAANPMAGYNTDSEATLWIQTRKPARIQVTYWPEEFPEFVNTSKAVFSDSAKGNTAIIYLSELMPETHYQFDLYLNDRKAHLPYSGRFETQPPIFVPFDFRLAVGSCAFIKDKNTKGNGGLISYGGKYGVFESLADQQPDYMLWMGDNIYLRDEEWKDPKGYYYRYSHTRALPEMQRLLATTHHVAIWDDHDFGPNNSGSTWRLKDVAVKAFYDFWPNPPQANPKKQGIYSSFRIGDVEIFLTDDRYFRAVENIPEGQESFLGKTQLDWLIGSLNESDAVFKLVAVGSEVLSDCGKGEGYYFQCRSEWMDLLSQIVIDSIEGVVFLSGDKHFTALSAYTVENFYPFYDLTVSPLSSIPNPLIGRKNSRRLGKTFVGKRNFALLDFSGNTGNRVMHIHIHDRKGKPLWDYRIGERDLRIGAPPPQMD